MFDFLKTTLQCCSYRVATLIPIAGRLIMALCLMTSTAHTASFDCTKAVTEIEHAVCGDPDLSELDSRLAKAYKAMRSRSDNPKSLRDEQRAWLRNVRNRCRDKRCLNVAYIKRLKVLSARAVDTGVPVAAGEATKAPTDATISRVPSPNNSNKRTTPESRKAGEVFRDCPTCPEMVVVPSGSFRMGDLNDDGDYAERPIHRVTISHAFAAGKYEVTISEWGACVSEGECRNPPDWGPGARRPVVDISWEEAQKYIQWLSRKTSKSYRFLTESEWEYMARAGNEGRYPWGNEIGVGRANCDGCGGSWDSDGLNKLAPVGSFAANEFGIHDTVGNVVEWVEDCWHDSYTNAPTDGTAWTDDTIDGDCDVRVYRGGSRTFKPGWVRSASRRGYPARDHNGSTGFRLARTLSGSLAKDQSATTVSDQMDDPERKTITVRELNNYRPANMFKLWENKQPTICEPLLTSLNTPLSRENFRGPPLLDLNFMKNKFLIKWQKQVHEWNVPSAGIKTNTWDAAFLDFDGDGTRDGLFRQSSMLSGNLFHDIRFVRSIGDRIADSQHLDEDTARKIVLDKSNNFPLLGNWQHHIELVEIANRPYVIVANAAWMHKVNPPPNIQLVIPTAKSWERICGFVSVIEIAHRN